MGISVCLLLARCWQLPEVLLVIAALRDIFGALGVLAKLCAAKDALGTHWKTQSCSSLDGARRIERKKVVVAPTHGHRGAGV